MKHSATNDLFNNKQSFTMKTITTITANLLSKLKHILFEERKSLKRKRLGNEIIPAASFYDELHFANYE